MNHPAEIKVHQYLSSVQAGEATLSEEVIEQVANDVRNALVKQFSKREDKFRLRMSNIGRNYCQLWFDKNDPKAAVPFSTNFIINMMIGDIVEAVFKGLLVQSGVSFSNGEKVTWDLGTVSIDGTPDLIMDGKVDDVKSASPWSYENKFKDYNTLAEKDSFGYVAQLAGYAQAAKVKPGGWWVVNKANGEFKYVAADGIDVEKAAENTRAIAAKLEENKFERCYDAIEETYRKKPTGNTILGRECQWCSYRYKCWPGLKGMPSLVSQAEDKPIVSYVKIDEKYAV
jgi:hypothetical protein